MADNPVSTAMNAAAPASERYDAQVEFAESQGTLQQALQFDIGPVIAQVRDVLEEQDFAKALRGNVVQFPNSRRPSERGGHSVFLDEFQVASQGQYWDRPGLLGFDSMRAMIDQTPILNSILLTRIRQVLRFCRPQSERGDIGFRVMHVDPTVELGDDQQRSIDLLQRFLINGGWETDPRRRKRLKRDTFSQFMAKSVRDTLTLDACPIETEFKRDRSLGVDGFYAVDGSTIRLCTEEGYEGDDEVFAVQVIQGQIRTAYNYDQLVYEVRNPRTDVTACGYGYSETEMLIKVVTYLLNTMTYNGAFFDKNSIPRGILQVYGNYDQSDLAAFKRYWNSMVRGINNAHNLPVLVSKDQESGASFTEVGGQMNEMAFAKWMSLLTSIACAVYGVAPEEISMESYSSGKSALSGDDTEEKLISSNDKGLRPLLGFYENLISDFVLQPFSSEYVLRFVGLDEEGPRQRFERQKLASTWNEMRQSVGLDPAKNELGDAPMNPSLIGTWNQMSGIGQEPEDYGDPDGDGEEPQADGGDPEAGGEPGQPGQPGEGDDGAGEPDFGAGEGDQAGAPFGKALGPSDFGLPPIYIIGE